jgi:hypothetical protein
MLPGSLQPFPKFALIICLAGSLGSIINNMVQESMDILALLPSGNHCVKLLNPFLLLHPG